MSNVQFSQLNNNTEIIINFWEQVPAMYSVCFKEITYISGPLWSISVSQSTYWKLTIRHQVRSSTSAPVELDTVCNNSGSEATCLI